MLYWKYHRRGPGDEHGYVYQISFKEKRKTMFQWPGNKSIVCSKTDIEPPTPSGTVYKTNRNFAKLLNVTDIS